MNKNFLFQIIQARVWGTGVDLGNDFKKGRSDTPRKVWGIKSFLNAFVRKIFLKLQENVSFDDNLYSANMLEKPIINCLKLFHVDLNLFYDSIRIFKATPEAWNVLDSEQKSGIYVNGFFMAIEDHYENIEKPYFSEIGPEPDFKKSSLGFIFRAFAYSKVSNTFLFNNGYSNVQNRLWNRLLDAYNEEYIQVSNSMDINDDLSDDRKVGSNGLNSNDSYLSPEIMQGLKPDSDIIALKKSLQYIKENGIKSAIDDVEFLLSHENEEIQDMALEIVMDLKELNV